MQRKLIGIVGYIGSGKTLAARRLVEQHGFTRLRVADPLKRMLKVGLGLTDEEIDGDAKGTPMPRFNNVTPRYIMQTLGTDWGRKMIYPDLWLDALRARLAITSGHVVVDDVRFPNEANLIKEGGGEIWRVFRPGTGMMAHPSETAQGEITEDKLITNATSVTALFKCVDALLED